MAKLKIGVLTPSISRIGAGVSESARIMASAAMSNGPCDVEVLTLHDQHFVADRTRWNGVGVTAYQTIGPRRYGFSPGMAAGLLSKNYDVLHVHGIWMFHCFAALLWARRWRRPYVVTAHGMLDPWILRRSALLKRTVSAAYQKNFLENAAVIHALNEHEQKIIKQIHPYANVSIIPNAIDVSSDRGRKPDWWSADLSDKDIYLFLGRIHEKKGCIELLEAWDITCRSNPAFQRKSVLVFCGWIDALKGFEAKLADIARKHLNVLFAGPQYDDAKQRSLGVATYFVLPSKSEGLPMTVLEAWTAGKPVLMSAECNLGEAFAVGAAAPMPPTVSGIAECLSVASRQSKGDRELMGSTGRAFALERYSHQAVGSRLSALYEQIARP